MTVANTFMQYFTVREDPRELVQDDDGQMKFSYSLSCLDDPEMIAISYSLPLEKKIFTQKECRAFFAGILPKANQRKLIAKNLGISANNDFSMLEKIGGEYNENRITIKNFETFAQEAGLAIASVRQRVFELAELSIVNLQEIEISHPIERELSLIIASRCNRLLQSKLRK